MKFYHCTGYFLFMVDFIDFYNNNQAFTNGYKLYYIFTDVHNFNGVSFVKFVHDFTFLKFSKIMCPVPFFFIFKTKIRTCSTGTEVDSKLQGEVKFLTNIT